MSTLDLCLLTISATFALTYTNLRLAFTAVFKHFCYNCIQINITLYTNKYYI